MFNWTLCVILETYYELHWISESCVILVSLVSNLLLFIGVSGELGEEIDWF